MPTDLLVCTACRGELAERPDGLLCTSCGRTYPIRDGVRDNEPYWRLSGYCSLGEVAVAVFFVISGLLVARSYLADPNPWSYLRKRMLRIMPGLVAFMIT